MQIREFCNFWMLVIIACFVIFVLFSYFDLWTWQATAQAKTINVEKVSVVLVSDNGQGQGQYSITLQCQLLVDGTPEYTFNITKYYQMGTAPSALYNAFYDAMDKVIDKYNDEQVIYNHAQLDSVVSNLESNLSW